MSSDHLVAERLLAERAERRRIAEQLHDGPVQHVAALSQMLDAAVAALEDGDVATGQRVAARALAVARDAAEELRGIVAGLEPVTLNEVGLAAAVREVATRTAGRRGASVEVAIADAELGEGARSSLFQVIREALDQAVRRGPPTSVSVTLVRTATGGVEHLAQRGYVLYGPIVELLGDPPPLGPLREQALGDDVLVAQSIIASRSAMATAWVRVSASSFARM